MSERAGIFDIEPIDVSGFTPSPPKEKAAREHVRQVAEQAQFRSREPEQRKLPHRQRVHRTGRNSQFNIKADPKVIEQFYQLAESQGWVLGLVLERAVQALQKEIEPPTRIGQGHNDAAANSSVP